MTKRNLDDMLDIIASLEASRFHAMAQGDKPAAADLNARIKAARLVLRGTPVAAALASVGIAA